MDVSDSEFAQPGCEVLSAGEQKRVIENIQAVCKARADAAEIKLNFCNCDAMRVGGPDLNPSDTASSRHASETFS